MAGTAPGINGIEIEIASIVSLSTWLPRRRLDFSPLALLPSRAVELGKDDGNVLWMAAFAVWRLAQDAQRARELHS